MARLVVFGSSVPCPDMARFSLWLSEYAVSPVEFVDIHRDPAARQRVVEWTGHASVPTLVIAEDGSWEPVSPPTPLAPGQRVRAFDRGTILTEPNPGQISAFLARHDIAVVPRGTAESAP